MDWRDEGIILSVRAHGETAAVLEVLTRDHGRHLGLVHGGRSRTQRAVLQAGNHVDVIWKARVVDALGHFGCELRRGFAAEAMDDAGALAAISSICALAHLLPERDPHPSLYEVTLFVASFLSEPEVWPALMVRWELGLLDEFGVGLDLSQCASTGVTTGLVYVSPRTGRAVSAAAGAPYHDRLLRLPAFLAGDARTGASREDVRAGLALTGHFLETRILQPRNLPMPPARLRLVELATRDAD
jgi:DNA repair protein RecO (recombination protein O)